MQGERGEIGTEERARESWPPSSQWCRRSPVVLVVFLDVVPAGGCCWELASVRAFLCTHVCVCVGVCGCSRACVGVCPCASYLFMHVYTYTFVCACVCACARACVCVCVLACVCACVSLMYAYQTNVCV